MSFKKRKKTKQHSKYFVKFSGALQHFIENVQHGVHMTARLQTCCEKVIAVKQNHLHETQGNQARQQVQNLRNTVAKRANVISSFNISLDLQKVGTN